jgi:UDP-3-O-[3-hydroxymyristoyl] N-acetylglucosamine deacetylase
MSVLARMHPLMPFLAAETAGVESILGRVRMGLQRARQTTLRRGATVSGIGVHSGRDVTVTIHPAAAGSGVTFYRSHDDGGHRRIPATVRHVSATDLCTAVGVPGASVATVEHLMAALSALGVDNATVEIDGPEVPIMDGSAGPFIEAVDEAGVERLEAPLRYIKVTRPVRVEDGEAYAEFSPYSGRRIEVEIDFDNPLIGRQRFAADVDRAFRHDIARARTFGFLADVEKLLARGLARGASLENAVVVGEDRVINPEGLRFSDEFVRHKVLDAIGDLALAGAPIVGRYRSYRGGHRLNVLALRALIEREDAWTMVEAPAAVRESGHAELAAGLVVAYGADAS